VRVDQIESWAINAERSRELRRVLSARMGEMCLREHSRAIAELGARGRSRLSLAHRVSARRLHLSSLSFRSHPPFPVTPALGSYRHEWCPARVAESRVLASARPPRPPPPAVRERMRAWRARGSIKTSEASFAEDEICCQSTDRRTAV
jgi:hypothetical protein